MSKLAAIKKQIAALEAEAERIAKQEMSSAIAKVKEIMSTFGLTIEDLQKAVGGKKSGAAKKAKSKRSAGGVAKYADPKTGKTWSGFGRAPAWIANAKSREAFLVDKSGIKAPETAGKASVAKKRLASKAASAKKGAKLAAKKAGVAAKRATHKLTAPPVTNTKAAAKNTLKKRASTSKSVTGSTPTEGATPSAT